MEMQRYRIVKRILKHDFAGLIHAIFKKYYKDAVIKKVWYWGKNGQINQWAISDSWEKHKQDE